MKEDFYIGYNNNTPASLKRALRKIVLATGGIIILAALIFGFSQKKFNNSTFELSTETKISGVYHESPYPMLRVPIGENSFKNIILLGFGKFGANSYLDALKAKEKSLINKILTIEGNLIYYNGKTLLQITDEQKITLASKKIQPDGKTISLGQKELTGEVVDPKCYFGVMKPGRGKIHRSCAILCISGGIPPVLVTTDNNDTSEYFLLTDLKGNLLHHDILPYIGKPSKLTGAVEKLEDWYILKVDTSTIEVLNEKSSIY